MDPDIAEVKKFWDANPLFVGEVSEPVGSRLWFEAFDAIRMREAFCEGFYDWLPAGAQKIKMLDVGCGPGFWQRRLSGKVGQYYGIDISAKSIELARESQKIFALPGVLQVGNAQEIPFPDEFFDYVLSEGVIHHTPDTLRCVEEIYRVLKSGGRAHVSVYYKNFVLRSPLLFKMTMFFLRHFKVTLKGRGREEMFNVKNPEELIRVYDGKDNPIGRAYTRDEVKKMFSKFSKLRFEVYYLPLRAFRLTLPAIVHRWLASIFGLMILVKAEK